MDRVGGQTTPTTRPRRRPPLRRLRQQHPVRFIWDVKPTKAGRPRRSRAGSRQERRPLGVDRHPASGPRRPDADPTRPRRPRPSVPARRRTPTPVTPPTVKLQLDDTTIDLGRRGRDHDHRQHDKGLDWIQWEGDGSDDPALDNHRYDCDNRKDCARTWTVKPTKKGTVDIEADAKDRRRQLARRRPSGAADSVAPAIERAPQSPPTQPASRMGGGLGRCAPVAGVDWYTTPREVRHGRPDDANRDVRQPFP